MIFAIISVTLTCVEDKAPVKTEGDTLAGLKAYTVVHTLITVEHKALAYTKAHVFAQDQSQECYRHTETLLEVQPETL